jgi:hypothetical protein
VRGGAVRADAGAATQAEDVLLVLLPVLVRRAPHEEALLHQPAHPPGPHPHLSLASAIPSLPDASPGGRAGGRAIRSPLRYSVRSGVCTYAVRPAGRMGRASAPRRVSRSGGDYWLDGSGGGVPRSPQRAAIYRGEGRR